MIQQINKQIKIKLEKDKTKLPKNLQQNINQFWDKLTKENLNFYDGEIIAVQEIKENEEDILLNTRRTRYSHYLYDDRIGVGNSVFWCCSLWGGILLITKDNYFVLGEMAETTSTPFYIDTIGGASDINDVEQGKINITKTIERELKEEMNLELNDAKQIVNYHVKYIERPEGRRHVYGVIAVGNINMTKLEIENHYKKYLKYLQDNKKEIEFKSIKFIPIGRSKQTLGKMKNPKREYILQLLEIEETQLYRRQ